MKTYQNAVSDFLPTVSDYGKLLCIACDKFKIDMNEARSKYGLYTWKQWDELLQLNNNYDL